MQLDASPVSFDRMIYLEGGHHSGQKYSYMTNIPSKWCSVCERDLPISEFWKDRSRQDGLCYYCKKCLQPRQSLYYQTYYYPTHRKELIAAEIKRRKERRLPKVQGGVTRDRSAFGHQAMGQADEIVSFRRPLVSSTDASGEVRVEIGISQSRNLGVAIYDRGKLHRYRVLPAELFMRLVADGFDEPFRTFPAIEVGNYWIAVTSEANFVKLRVWWVRDWEVEVARGTEGDNLNLQLMDLLLGS